MTTPRHASDRIIGPLVGQLARPHGRLAGVTARLLNRSNRSINAAAVEALLPVPDMPVLEVGFGGGVALDRLLAVAGLRVVALETSAEMILRAHMRFAAALASGRLHLRQGTVESLPLPNNSVGAALSVNSMYFWPDQATGLREIYRVLCADGRLALGVEITERGADIFARQGFHMAPLNEIEEMLGEAQFKDIGVIEVTPSKHVVTASKAPKRPRT